MGLINTLNVVLNHPLNKHDRMKAFFRYAKWQIGSRLIPGEIIHEWINGVRFAVRPKETGLIESIYTGLLEFEDMAFFLHSITPEDVFIDVGANIGTYTLLACGVKGAKGFAFEPVPATFNRLVQNIRLNNMEDRVKPICLGIGDKPGTIHFTADENVTNHALPGKIKGKSIEVKIGVLDKILRNEKPTAMKIDVEGYEIPVLNGAKNTLKKPSLNAVLIETNGSGSRYGYLDDQIVAAMKAKGFMPYAYDPFQRKLKKMNGINPNSGNTLFVRNLGVAERRVKSAKPVNVLGRVL